MAATALLKFTQGSVAGQDGEALVVASGVPVSVSNSDNTDVASWRIEVVDGPSVTAMGRESTFREVVPGAPLLLAENSASATPSTSFIPDIPGSYRIRLTVFEAGSFAGASDTDIRNVIVPTAAGELIPPFQDDPKPLPGKPNELNVGGQPFGWSGRAGVDLPVRAATTPSYHTGLPVGVTNDINATTARLRPVSFNAPYGMVTDDEGCLWVLLSAQYGDGGPGAIRYNPKIGAWDDYFLVGASSGSGREPFSITYINDHVWVICRTTGEVWAYNVKTQGQAFLAHSIPTMAFQEARHLASGEYNGSKYVYIPGITAGAGSATVVFRLDVTDVTSITETESVALTGTYDNLWGIDFDPVRGRVYVSDVGSTTRVHYLDHATFTSASSFVDVSDGNATYGMVIGDGRLWITFLQTSVASVIVSGLNLDTLAEEVRVDLGFIGSPLDITYDPHHHWLWVSGGASNSNVFVVDTVAESLLYTLPLTGTRSFHIHWNSGYTWVTDPGSGSTVGTHIYKFDTRTLSIVEEWTGEDQAMVYDRLGAWVIDDATPSGSIIPDNVHTVIINTTAGNAKTIFLPPFQTSPNSTNPTWSMLRLRGYELRIVDVGGAINREDSQIRLSSQYGIAIWSAHKATDLNTSEFFFNRAYGSVKLRFDPTLGGSYGYWHVTEMSEPWSYFSATSPGTTIPLGRTLVMCFTSAITLSDPSTALQGWGNEVLIKAHAGSVVVSAAGGSTIDNGKSSITLEVNGFLHLIYAGTEWSIVAHSGVFASPSDTAPGVLLNKTKSTSGVVRGVDATTNELFFASAGGAMPMWDWTTGLSGDPGSGHMGGNNATITSITRLRFSHDSGPASLTSKPPVSLELDQLRPDDVIRIADITNPEFEGSVFRVSGSPIGGGTYTDVPVTYVTGSATPSFSDTDTIAVQFVATRNEAQLDANQVLTSSVDDYVPWAGTVAVGFQEARLVTLSSIGPLDITGLASPGSQNVRLKKLVNRGSFPITFKHENAGSSASYRFRNPGGVDIVLNPDDIVDATYDSTAQRWRLG